MFRSGQELDFLVSQSHRHGVTKIPVSPGLAVAELVFNGISDGLKRVDSIRWLFGNSQKGIVQ